jgi:hypothetical protein
LHIVSSCDTNTNQWLTLQLAIKQLGSTEEISYKNKGIALSGLATYIFPLPSELRLYLFYSLVLKISKASFT